MFQFAYPERLYLLLIFPFLIVIYIMSLRAKRRKETLLAERPLFRQLTPLRSTIRPVVKFALFCFSVALCVTMIARPQYGHSSDTETKKGIEVIFALDVSKSMLATDVMPNRLERSRLLISTLIDRMQDDKTGLIVFAGEAYPQMPISNDRISAKLFLDNITTDMVSLQGTNIGAAIRLASKCFTQEKGVGKAIVLITDGENHEGGALEEAKAAAKEGKHIFVMGIGNPEGANIPTNEGLLTDNSGETVVTRLNSEMCQQIAKAGNGAFYHIDGSSLAQDQLQQDLSKLQRNETKMVYGNAIDEQFQAFAVLLLFILLLEMFIPGKKNPFYDRFHLFQTKQQQ